MQLEQQFNSIFANLQTIADCTVYEEKIFDNGRQFVYQYSGKQKDLVEKKARAVVANLDKMRCPVAGNVHLVNGIYEIAVTYYGLD